MTLQLDERTDTTPPPAATAPMAWYASIIMRDGWPDVEYHCSYAHAMTPLRERYHAWLCDHDPADHCPTCSAGGARRPATLAQLNDRFHNGHPGYWMDIVPAADVLPRILATMAARWTGPTAIATLDGCVDVVPYPTADAAETALRAQAQEWGLDDPTIDPQTAALEDLCAAYRRQSDQAWIGLIPIITTGGQRLALVPIDHLPTDA